MDKLKMHTSNKADENFRKLAAMFPNAVTETINENGEVVRAIDKDVLMQEISCTVVDGNEERYQFTWPDKKKSVLLASAPINKTLRPVRDDETAPTGADSEGKPYCSSGSVDFDTTENLYIEGDNLEVLKLLQETYLGKIKIVYIDPPYNTGNDFVYEDDFAQDTDEYLANSGQYDEDGNHLVQNAESNGRFHTDWLNMLYPRLKLARDLLSDDGVIFISIDDNEVENAKKIGKEIFGDKGFISQLVVVSNLKGRNDGKHFASCHEYLLIFAKQEFIANGVPLTDEQRAEFNLVDKEGNAYQLRDLRKRGNADKRSDRPNMYFPIYFNPTTNEVSLEFHTNWVEIVPMLSSGEDGRWRWGKERVLENISLLEPKYSERSKKWGVNYRVYLNPKLNPLGNEDCEEKSAKAKTLWMGGEISSDVARRELKKLMTSAPFEFPKSPALIQRILQVGSSKHCIVLDFFSGSATTAHAVMQLNAEDGGHRKFIMVQLPEATDEKSEAYKAGYKNICEIGKERIRRAGKKIQEERLEAIAFSKHEWDQTCFYVEHKEECDRLGHLPDEYFAKEHPPIDTGFRVLKCDTSNMKEVYYNPAEYEASLFSSLEDNIKEDRTPEDLLFQVMLDLGVLLSSKIVETTIADKKVFNVEDNYLIACFDSDVTEETITAIAKQKPYYFVMRDSSMANDSVATNFDQIFATYSPDTVRKVL